VNDLNRNRRWEPARERAQPFEHNSITPSDGLQSTVWIYEPDTVAPRVQGVGVLALNQLRIRTSESLVLENDSVELSLLEGGAEGQILEQVVANQLIEWNARAELLEEDSTTVAVTVDSLQSLRSDGNYILLSINQIEDRSRNLLSSDSLAFNTNDVVEIVAPDSSRAVDSDTVEFDGPELVDGQGIAELLVVLEVFDMGADSTLATSPQTYPIVATLELIEPFSSRVLADTVLTQPMHSRDSTQPAESAPYQDLNGDGEWSFNTNPAEPRRVVSNIQLLNDFEGTVSILFGNGK
jgi:hypothetical protein